MTEAAPPVVTNEGPRPVLIEDIYRVLGAMYLEIETLRRQVAYYKSREERADGRDARD